MYKLTTCVAAYFVPVHTQLLPSHRETFGLYKMAPANTSKHHTTFDLLAIPLELRLHIYEQMRSTLGSAHLNLLCTCRKINLEARESFLSRPVQFGTQAALARNVGSRRHGLEQVFDLKLGLTEISRDDMSPFLAQIVVGMSKLKFQNSYEIEAARITTALRTMPNIKSLTLTEPFQAPDTPAPKVLVNHILAWTSQSYCGLRHLRLDMPNISLEPLASFRLLRSLRITSFSETSAAQARIIFEQLTALDELHLVARGRQSRYLQCQNLKRSIDPHVIHHVRPLRILGIYDFADLINKRAGFITADMLKAIGGRHGGSLQELRLSSISPLGHSSLSRLEGAFAVMSQVHTLSLAWPGIEPELTQHLPSSTWSLELFVSGNTHASDLLDALLQCHHRYPKLRKIKLLLPASITLPEMSTFDLENFLARSSYQHQHKRRPEKPWTVSWGTWHPGPSD